MISTAPFQPEQGARKMTLIFLNKRVWTTQISIFCPIREHVMNHCGELLCQTTALYHSEHAEISITLGMQCR